MDVDDRENALDTDDDDLDEGIDDDGYDGDEDDQPRDDDPAEPEVDPVDRLRDLVTYLAENLVDDPEGVEVDAERRGVNVHLSLRVPETELGKVIGRQGRIARAVRTAVGITAARDNLRASLDIEG